MNDEHFQRSVEKLEECVDKFLSMADPKIKEFEARFLKNLNNSNQVQKYFEQLIKSHDKKRQLSNIVQSMHELNTVQFSDRNLILSDLKRDLV